MPATTSHTTMNSSVKLPSAKAMTAPIPSMIVPSPAADDDPDRGS